MAEYDFEMRVAHADRSGYCVTRWDRSTPITVRAATKQAAIEKARAVMGPAPSGHYWTVRTFKVTEAVITDAAVSR